VTEHIEALNKVSGGAEARRSELQTKHSRLTAWLDQSGLDAILLRRHENLAWFSAGQIEARVANGLELAVVALLLLRDGRGFALAPNNEAPRLADEELTGLGFELIVRPWHALNLEAETLKLVPRQAGAAHIATDAPLGRFEPADLGALRAPLTPPEVARYRTLGHLAADAVTETLLTVQPGVSEYELEASTAGRLLRQGIFPSVLLMAADRRILTYKHAVARGARVDRYAMLNLCARRWGLIVSITRFVHFGPMPAELERGFAVAAEVNAALQHASRAGITASSLFNTAANAYIAAGFPGEEQLHHQGGACGYQERDWVATPAATQVVQSTEAFAWNPSCRGGKVEDTTLLLEGSIELLTPTPNLPQVTTERNGIAYISAGVLVHD
jgi:Xaa-Pro dipeptidase